MSSHASTVWHPEWPPLDAFAMAQARQNIRHDFSQAAHDSDRLHVRGGRTPARVQSDVLAGLVEAANRREAPGLVSVPTKFQTALAVAAESLDSVLLTDEAKAKRRLAKLRMAVGFAARGHAVSEKGHRSDKAWMVTLTYRPGCEWSANHVQKALLAFRNFCRKKGLPCRYVWVAEIQDGKRRSDGVGRHVIHYHAVVYLPVGVRCPHFDRRGWWPHGMSRTDPPVVSKNPVGYLLHYLKKDKDLSAMPKGARAYGVGGLDSFARRSRRWLGLPSFVQANSDIWGDWRRASGGGWRSPSGVVYPSEFQRCKVGGIDALIRVCRHLRTIDASGPFSWIGGSGAAAPVLH
jgi:hypothetical protein